MKGQNISEYLVISAIVLIVALLIIGLLGGDKLKEFGIGKEQKNEYWKYTSPFSIQDIKINNNIVEIKLKNELNQTISLTQLYLDETDIISSGYVFNPTQTIIIKKEIFGFKCTKGQPYEFKSIKFVYNKGELFGLTQTGNKGLYGKCS